MSFEMWKVSDGPVYGHGPDEFGAMVDGFLKASEQDRFHSAELRPGFGYEVRPGPAGDCVWVRVDHGGQHATLFKTSPYASEPVVMHQIPAAPQDEVNPDAYNPNDVLIVARGVQKRGGLYTMGVYGLVRHIRTTRPLDRVGLYILRSLKAELNPPS